MKPGDFSVENAIEILPDEYRRVLTAEARSFADAGKEPRSDFGEAPTYWDGVVIEHKRCLWMETYEKRKARMERIANGVRAR